MRIGSFTTNGLFGGPQPQLTLDALMARQREIARANAQVTPEREMISPWQGAAYLGDVLAGTVQQRQADEALAAGQQGYSQAMSGIAPGEVPTGEQIAAVSKYDPDTGMALWKMAADMINARRNQETFATLTPEEEAAAFGSEQPGTYQKSSTTGKISEVGGGGTNITVATGAGDKKWNESSAAKFGERVDAYSSEGVAAQQQLNTINQLEFLTQDMPTGLTAQATQYLRDNWGISLGEGSTKLQAFEALTNKLVPSQRPPGSGTMSDRDVQLFKDSLPNYLNSPEGNRLILASMRGIAEYNAKLGAIADQALQMPDVNAARQFFTTEANKLQDPLAEWRTAEVARQKAEGGGGGGTIKQPKVGAGGALDFSDMTDEELDAWTRAQEAAK